MTGRLIFADFHSPNNADEPDIDWRTDRPSLCGAGRFDTVDRHVLIPVTSRSKARRVRGPPSAGVPPEESVSCALNALHAKGSAVTFPC